MFGILFLLGLIGALVYLSSRTYKKEIVKASSQMVLSVTSTVQSMRYVLRICMVCCFTFLNIL